MTQAFYMTFSNSGEAGTNHIGGKPIGFPLGFPWSSTDDDYYAFVAEFEAGSKRLQIGSADFLQLYQPLDEGDDPTPVVVLASRHLSEAVSKRRVETHPHVEPKLIQFDEYDDPDSMPEITTSLEVARLFKSKLGGVDPWTKDKRRYRFLGQLKQEPSGLNFAGLTCLLYWCEEEDRPIAELK